MANNPYKGLPDQAFWKRAISSRHYEDMTEIWSPPELSGAEKFATAGSCFAQHIGRHIARRGASNYLDLEPAPAFLPQEEHGRYGYGIYSCRYGNIYTSRQLLQLAHEALGTRPMSEHVWEKDGRFYDAIRPNVDPVGQPDRQTVHELRKVHLTRVSEMLSSLDVFVFTLGLTETWVDPSDGTVFPTAPGVIAGDPRSNPADFVNLSIDDVREDLFEFWEILRDLNPNAQMILTVSPVPLIATASGNHVLSATTYSKSVLRVAAEELATSRDGIHYFPSYEIINSAAGKGYYFEPDLRGVNPAGVRYVMSHFFSGSLEQAFPNRAHITIDADGVVCDEERIEENV